MTLLLLLLFNAFGTYLCLLKLSCSATPNVRAFGACLETGELRAVSPAQRSTCMNAGLLSRLHYLSDEGFVLRIALTEA